MSIESHSPLARARPVRPVRGREAGSSRALVQLDRENEIVAATTSVRRRDERGRGRSPPSRAGQGT
jgi:hypothetical protein